MGFLNMRTQTDKIDKQFFFSKISISIKYTNYTMENALYDFYSLVEEYQKTHSFATLTRSCSDTPQLVNKNRTRAFSME